MKTIGSAVPASKNTWYAMSKDKTLDELRAELAKLQAEVNTLAQQAQKLHGQSSPTSQPVAAPPAPAPFTAPSAPVIANPVPEKPALQTVLPPPTPKPAIRPPALTYQPDTLRTLNLIDQADDSNRASVRPMQQALKTLHLYDGKIDGGYGPKTRQAVEAFKHQFASEITTIRTEQEQQRNQAQAERIQRIGTALPHLSELDATKRKALEQDLKEAGFKPGKVDGHFDNTAYTAMRRYTTQHPESLHQIKQHTTELAVAEPSTLGNAKTAALQDSLNMLGFAAGRVDGHMGASTLKARDAYLTLNTTPAQPAAATLKNPLQARKVQSELERLGYFSGPMIDHADQRVIKGLNTLVEKHPHLGLHPVRSMKDISNHHLKAAEFLSETEGKWAPLQDIKVNREAITNNKNKPATVALNGNGDVIGGNRPFSKADPMSISKMMTLYTIADMGKKGELPGGMSAEKFLSRYQNLVHNMMVYSHNDAPYKLALLATGTMNEKGTIISAPNASGFVDHMNQTGRELGFIDTHFSKERRSMTRTFTSGARFTGEVGPVGYNDQHGGQHMTALDAARIGQTFAKTHPDIFNHYVNGYGIYRGKTGTGAGDYERDGGQRRSFIGVNRDGSAFAMLEVPPHQFGKYKDEMSRMARGKGPKGSGNVIENLVDTIGEFLQGAGAAPAERDEPLDVPPPAPTPASRAQDARRR